MIQQAIPLSRRANASARGVATLTMVMILFFVMAMVAAYANRNLIYEQRTSINFYREAASMSAAEAGVDWAMAMLSGGRIDANCDASASAADGDFRSRYLQVQGDGTYMPVLWSFKATPASVAVLRTNPLACVQTAAGWRCSCPTNDQASLTFVDGTAPVFRVEVASGGQPGVLTVRSRGCSSLGNHVNITTDANQFNACHRATGSTRPFVDSVADLQVSLGLARALPVPPVAALTAGENLTMAAGTLLRVSNVDPTTGVTVHVGAALTANTKHLVGPAGSAAANTVEGDADLSALAVPVNAAMALKKPLFSSVFGLDPATFRRQPAVRIVPCLAGCTSADIAAPLANEPSRIIWVDGSINLDQAGTIGTAAQPVMLVATGTITLSAAVEINGFMYGDNLTWAAGSAGSVLKGAAVAHHDIQGNAPVVVAYDADILRTISNTRGSFVRVPGSWQLTPLQN